MTATLTANAANGIVPAYHAAERHPEQRQSGGERDQMITAPTSNFARER
jgi:hypothetical protein